MAEVFMCQRGQLDARSKRDLRAAGVVVVEVEDMTRAQFIKASEIVSADDMLWATLDALNHTPNGYGDDGAKQREQLAVNLLRIVTHRMRPTAIQQPAPKETP